MKTIGLIGGMSWESSKVYYELINRRVMELLGGSHSAKSIMISVDFQEIANYTFDDNWDGIGDMMEEATQQLEKAGVDLILLCTNTIHLVSDRIKNNTNIPFLHIADAVGEEITNRKTKRVALLGTKFTMEKDFYTKILEEKYGLEVITPGLEDREIMNSIIYNELVKGKISTESKRKCLRIIDGLVSQGAEGIILGCTELPLLIQPQDVTTQLFDTTKIHAYKAVETALEN